MIFITKPVENGMIVGAHRYDAQWETPRLYICPECGREISGDTILYKAISTGDIIACEYCTRKTDAWAEYEYNI